MSKNQGLGRPALGERFALSLFRQMLKLPRGTQRYLIDKTVRIPMRDGVELTAEHWAPIGDSLGTVMVQTPYGRNALWGAIYAAPYASRGYHVVLCSSRGTFGSDGEFDPMMSEVDDVADVSNWLRQQPWFRGRFAMVGASYLGYTQYALLMDPPPELAAVVVQVGFHDLEETLREGGALKLNDFLAWSEFVAHQERYGILTGLIRLATVSRRIAPAWGSLPLGRGVDDVLGSSAPWFKRWLSHPDAADEFWAPVQLRAALDRVKVPVLLHTGWMDIFLDQTMEQYDHLSSRGVEVALTAGPWIHGDIEAKAAHQLVPETLQWLDTYVAGLPDEIRSAPVKIFVTGANQWREYTQWPPLGRTIEFHPHADGSLHESHPGDGALSFTYDPAAPTPTVGGRLLTSQGGYRNDGKLADRGDVLTFTSEPLQDALEIGGRAELNLAHSSENGHADLFVRISEVDRKGRSRNVVDGFVRLDGTSSDGSGDVRQIRITFDPTAHQFGAGSRIRLFVAGGCFPRFDRNLGAGEDPLTATSLSTSTRTIDLNKCTLSIPVV